MLLQLDGTVIIQVTDAVTRVDACETHELFVHTIWIHGLHLVGKQRVHTTLAQIFGTSIFGCDVR